MLHFNFIYALILPSACPRALNRQPACRRVPSTGPHGSNLAPTVAPGAPAPATAPATATASPPHDQSRFLPPNASHLTAVGLRAHRRQPTTRSHPFSIHIIKTCGGPDECASGAAHAHRTCMHTVPSLREQPWNMQMEQGQTLTCSLVESDLSSTAPSKRFTHFAATRSTS